MRAQAHPMNSVRNHRRSVRCRMPCASSAACGVIIWPTPWGTRHSRARGRRGASWAGATKPRCRQLGQLARHPSLGAGKQTMILPWWAKGGRHGSHCIQWVGDKSEGYGAAPTLAPVAPCAQTSNSDEDGWRPSWLGGRAGTVGGNMPRHFHPLPVSGPPARSLSLHLLSRTVGRQWLRPRGEAVGPGGWRWAAVLR